MNREWLNSDEINNHLCIISDYSYHIDVLLFSAAKTRKKKS